MRDVVFIGDDITALGFRLAGVETHSPEPETLPALVAELCRVARRAVVVDYPTGQSLNRFAPLLFGAKKRLEGDTRTWTLFRHRQVLDAFSRNRYVLDCRRHQFFFPMVLHRALKCRTLSVALESLCELTGLTSVWGSPVIVKMVRKGQA